jgi:hypothetical protein
MSPGSGDKGISVRLASFMGAYEQSLMIDTGKLDHINEQIFSRGTITLYGVTSVGIWDGRESGGSCSPDASS